MYYAFPEEDDAYPATQEALLGQIPSSGQYLFGEDLLVAPVTVSGTCPAIVAATTRSAAGKAAASGMPADYPCGLARMDVWVPPGTWFSLITGSTISGPRLLTQVGVHLLDVPVYARSGSVVPRRPLDSMR